MLPANFSRIFKSKNKVFGPVQIPKKNFIWILVDFVPVLCEKVVIFGFSAGTKSEKLNSYSSNILNPPLVPVLNPQESKKSFFGYLRQSKYLVFGPKKI
jgi:hypothetical protein